MSQTPTTKTRRVLAGQSVIEDCTAAQQPLRTASPKRIDTHQLQDSRAILHFGDDSQAAPCPPGFCGFDAKCTDRGCPGHPAHITQLTGCLDAQDAQDAQDGADTLNMMRRQVDCLIALAMVCCVAVVAFFIGMRI
jgi:hypothetical protein